MIDLHTHSFLSDGELIPSELVIRAEKIGYRAIGITDHVDFSNYKDVIKSILEFQKRFQTSFKIIVIPGAEITYVPPPLIPEFAKEIRSFGIKLIVVHGETLAETVPEETNFYALKSDIDILAHPGLITYELVKTAKEKGICLEITSRKGHSLSNGNVAKLASEAGANIVINTDSHSPSNLITKEKAIKIGLGAGLNMKDVEKAFLNSENLVKKITNK
ncbi:MAG: histidinol phosphate phosphatase domain-containing protein [bacterium]